MRNLMRQKVRKLLDAYLTGESTFDALLKKNEISPREIRIWHRSRWFLKQLEETSAILSSIQQFNAHALARQAGTAITTPSETSKNDVASRTALLKLMLAIRGPERAGRKRFKLRKHPSVPQELEDELLHRIAFPQPDQTTPPGELGTSS